MSERLLGALVGMHGDDAGLIMPPAIAPWQVVICPMIRKNSEVDTYQFPMMSLIPYEMRVESSCR